MISSLLASRLKVGWTAGSRSTPSVSTRRSPGAIWWEKGKVDALKDVHFEVDTRTERLGMDFVGQDKRSTFEPHRVVIERAHGKRDVAHVDGDEQGLRDPLVVTLPRVDAAGRGDHDAVDVAVVLSPNTRFTLNR